MNNNTKDKKAAGDMPIGEFRLYAHKIVDWIADYLEDIESYPVLSQVKPGEIKNNLPFSPPSDGEEMNDILDDFNKIIMPGITHWNHPGFMAYFNSTSSSPGILADFISSALNVNGMVWQSSPSSTELEEVSISWFRQMLGLPENFWGIIYDTASVSSMHAIAAAREQIVNLKHTQSGITAREVIPKLRLYTSEQAHSSIEKAAITLGIGLDGVRKIPVDNEFKMIPEKLSEAIEEDKSVGWIPFCAVATVGTTSTTSIDPVDKVAEICRQHNLWLHVDGAHGGIAASVPEMRFIFNGIEGADSLVINPHKWMFTPFDLSVLFTKKKDVLKQAFSIVPEYLKTSVDSEVENYMDYGIQLGRRFRSLKLWFILRYFGTNGIERRIREHLRLGNSFAEWIDGNQNFERMAPVPLSTVCFRAHPADYKSEERIDELNKKLLSELNKTGDVFLTHTILNGKFVIRLVISGLRTEERHVIRAEELIEKKLSELI